MPLAPTVQPAVEEYTNQGAHNAAPFTPFRFQPPKPTLIGPDIQNETQ